MQTLLKKRKLRVWSPVRLWKTILLKPTKWSAWALGQDAKSRTTTCPAMPAISLYKMAIPPKPVIASGQTYFAIQTRRQELVDDETFQQLDEDKKRMFLRNELKEHNKQLVETASHAGVKSSLDFAVFQNHGYQGLYGGLAAKDIHKRKGLKKSQHILDHMGSTELAANLFRATQTEEKTTP